jgi:hypothetical protein
MTNLSAARDRLDPNRNYHTHHNADREEMNSWNKVEKVLGLIKQRVQAFFFVVVQSLLSKLEHDHKLFLSVVYTINVLKDL